MRKTAVLFVGLVCVVLFGFSTSDGCLGNGHQFGRLDWLQHGSRPGR